VETGPHPAHAVLSARQRAVAKLVAAGHSTREIADKLSLSPRTVETHIAAIFEKLGVRTRAQLTALVGGMDDARTDAHIGNIPLTPVSLIGRETDCSAISLLAAKNRVVTILGTGGIGKTQTALRIAARSAHAYADGVWFVDLAPLTSGAFVPMEIAHKLNLSLPGTEDAQDALVSRLKNTTALLVLDNCEHLVHTVASIVGKLARACTRLTILTTSREPLGISGEATYRLPTLDAASAAELFIARARAVDNRFSVDEDGSRAITEICRKLDGLPLAIELAASRSSMFSPKQLLGLLECRFALLEGGPRDVLPRHKSLRALVDWSYDQLDEWKQSLFRRLSIFLGTFSLEAAAAIAGLAEDREFELIDSLSSLIDKSLVSLERESDATTYRLLESMHEYARMKLEERAETGDVARLHARYLVRQLSAINRTAKFATSAQAMLFFNNHLADIRAALDWAIQPNEILIGAELLIEIEFLWSSRSIVEGITRIEAYLAALGDRHPIHGSRLSSHLAELYWRTGDQDRALEAATRALNLARPCGDDTALSWALIAEATVNVYEDPDRALALLRELDTLAGASEASRQEGRQLRARLMTIREDFDQAAALYRELIEEERRLGNPVGEAQSTWMLANIEYRVGRPEKAVELGREARALIEQSRDGWAIATITRSLAGYLLSTGAYDEAERAAADALAIYADIAPESTYAGALVEIMATVATTRGAFVRAATLSGFANAIAEKPGAVAYISWTRALHDRLDQLLVASLSTNELTILRERGARLSAVDAIAIAVAMDDDR
jgi:predicted ATPase/DNA-binding CsgD family transcriptional regulator